MDEPEYLPLSWLSQICYCPRRAGLLLNERQWAENSDTAKGRAEHDRVHTQRIEKRGNSAKLYAYTVFSDRLRLLGKCDCIEVSFAEDGCMIPAVEHPVVLYPIEYKHGTLRVEDSYQVQLCAQAMCLEEMFHTTISKAALFFTSSHRRFEIVLDESLRSRTESLAQELHHIRRELSVPQELYGSKCKRCSLKDICMPKVRKTSGAYLERLQAEAAGEIKETSK